MANVNLNKAEFIKSAARTDQFIRSSLPKIAFAGKSNVGKSSVLNCILNRKNFAKVGAQPGKTIHVNYFLIDQKVYFVDLPGYGYAKVSQEERNRWGRLMESFFNDPSLLSFGVFVVDSRHKPTADDVTMAEFFHQNNIKVIVVANKVDKLKKSEIEPNIALIRETLSLTDEDVILPFSAQTRFNRDKLISLLFENI